jgi:Right handed beta helix region
MSYTLRGRLESRLAAVILPLAVAVTLAIGLREWWPVELAGLMVAVGLVLDAGVYHALLRYQPGWVALPLGALELVLVMGLAVGFDVAAPLEAAVGFFAASWLWAQVLGHAALPLLRPEYAEDGGELARAGRLLAAGVASAFVLLGGVAWATQPPVVHLHGVVQGPLVLDHEQTVVGGVVRGGIRITADGVTVRGTTTIGGDYGIEVREARDVRLERVTVVRAREDGIHARRSGVVIEDCNILAAPGTQGVDVSFAMHEHSEISGCRVIGGVSGIEVHYTMASIHDNVVVGSGIYLTEMSMGSIEDNTAHSIYCGDWSMCEIERNSAASIRVNANADARVRDNRAGRVSASADSVLRR